MVVVVELLLAHHESIPERQRMLTLKEGEAAGVIEERIIGKLDCRSLNVVDIDRCCLLASIVLFEH